VNVSFYGVCKGLFVCCFLFTRAIYQRHYSHPPNTLGLQSLSCLFRPTHMQIGSELGFPIYTLKLIQS
jgi:hypothetical protein